MKKIFEKSSSFFPQNLCETKMITPLLFSRKKMIILTFSFKNPLQSQHSINAMFSPCKWKTFFIPIASHDLLEKTLTVGWDTVVAGFILSSSDFSWCQKYSSKSVSDDFLKISKIFLKRMDWSIFWYLFQE